MSKSTDVVTANDNVCAARKVPGDSKFESLDKLFKPNKATMCYKFTSYYGNDYYISYSSMSELMDYSFGVTYENLLNTSRYTDVIKIYGLILNICKDILQVGKNSYKRLVK